MAKCAMCTRCARVEEWVTIGSDIIIAINETRITTMDDLSTCLEEYTLPGQTVRITIVRDNRAMTPYLS